MKYIFIDTNNLIYSALSSQKEHKIESLEKLKNVLKNDNAKLLLPEIVKIEFDRVAESVYTKIKGELDSLKNIKLPPYLEEEKNKLFRTIDEISKGKDKKYQDMRKEVDSLLTTKNVQYIPFDSDVLVQSYKRGMKREKPFKANDDSLRENFDFIEDTSWINDALIIESLVKVCKPMDKSKDTLLFCSNNTKDFAEHDKTAKKHHLHPDIKKDIQVETKYYLSLPDMLEKEFKESLSKETKANIKEAERFHGGLLVGHYFREQLMAQDALKEFRGASAKIAEYQKNLNEAMSKLGKMGLYEYMRMNSVLRPSLAEYGQLKEKMGLLSNKKTGSSGTETKSDNNNEDETGSGEKD